jgi:hypothetical protein
MDRALFSPSLTNETKIRRENGAPARRSPPDDLKNQDAFNFGSYTHIAISSSPKCCLIMGLTLCQFKPPF